MTSKNQEKFSRVRLRKQCYESTIRLRNFSAAAEALNTVVDVLCDGRLLGEDQYRAIVREFMAGMEVKNENVLPRQKV